MSFIDFSKFFSNIQEAPWYRSFLNSVIKEVEREGQLLDIGTGSGKLIQILSNENNMSCVGVDTNSDMLKEAEIKLKGTGANLRQIKADEKLPFENDSFDYITICNVLFHLKKESIDFMLDEARRILKKDGKIIILTPTGAKSILLLSKKYFSPKNLGIYIWYTATKKSAKIWNENNYLKEYTSNNQLDYQTRITMNGFAQLEIIK